MNRYLRFLMVCLGALLWASEGLALPEQFVQEGLLTDAQNRPLNGQKSMRVRLYGSPMGNDVLFEETHPAVAVINGYYALLIGARHPCLMVFLSATLSSLDWRLTGQKAFAEDRLFCLCLQR